MAPQSAPNQNNNTALAPSGHNYNTRGDLYHPRVSYGVHLRRAKIGGRASVGAIQKKIAKDTARPVVRQVLSREVLRAAKLEARHLRHNLLIVTKSRDNIKAGADAAIYEAAKEIEQHRNRADFFAGQLATTRTLLSVTAVRATADIKAAAKETAETEQHRAEACAEIESLREQLGIKTTELAELQGKYLSITAERNTLWSLVPPIPVAQFEVRRLIDIDRAGVKLPQSPPDINI